MEVSREKFFGAKFSPQMDFSIMKSGGKYRIPERGDYVIEIFGVFDKQPDEN